MQCPEKQRSLLCMYFEERDEILILSKIEKIKIKKNIRNENPVIGSERFVPCPCRNLSC